MPPFVISIFIAHQGCPHQCIFCNQWSITGGKKVSGPVMTGAHVAKEIKRQLAWPRKDISSEVQVAFYGGSFTGLPFLRQQELLGAVSPFIKSGEVRTIRLSTRPDYVEETTGPFLKGHGVGIVELGVQSMTQAVLDACERGHSVSHVEKAIGCLRTVGLTVGAQIMIGLPGETGKTTLNGVRRLIGLAPDFVRIYPALVFKGSKLAELWASGGFRPLSLDKAVVLTAHLKELFDKSGIRVVRMGLQPSAALESDLIDGPYHPAFGDLVMAQILFKKVRAALVAARRASTDDTNRKFKLSIARQDQSVFRGQKNRSINHLNDMGLLKQVEIVLAAKQERGTVFVTSA